LPISFLFSWLMLRLFVLIHGTEIAMSTPLPTSKKTPVLRIVACLVFPLALVACGNPKEASKANFKKALEDYFTENCSRLPVNVQTFPIVMNGGLPQNAVKYNALVEAGLLTRTELPVSTPVPLQGVRVLPNIEYNLTGKGKTLFKEGGGLLSGKPSGFCFGHVEIASIDSFSEPAQLNGQTISQVTFTANPILDDWAKSPTIQRAFPENTSGKSGQMTLPLVLMNDGWRFPLN